MLKFTLVMGEKPENTVGYILDVLCKMQQQRVDLMDNMRTVKDAGGCSLKDIKT
jgi:hypothetical protein